jgi:hypothetical protein
MFPILALLYDEKSTRSARRQLVRPEWFFGPNGGGQNTANLRPES